MFARAEIATDPDCIQDTRIDRWSADTIPLGTAGTMWHDQYH
jgi:hypothetical protein